jgi:hypothetical protein
MSNYRKKYSTNEQLILYSQVEGICPICTKPLYYKKCGQVHKKYEIAHIYPLNPTHTEINILKNEKRLSDDVNSLDNVIPLCLECHEKFDKPRTVEEYQTLYKIKKSLILKNKIMNVYSLFNIEDEIRVVLHKLNLDNGELTKLEYTALKIDQKANTSLPPLLKRQIKNDVTEYFKFIQNIFVEIDRETPNKFNTLAAQIKSFYFKCMQSTSNQEEIYHSIVEWLHNKTEKYSLRACEIITSFFVQDCEVLS